MVLATSRGKSMEYEGPIVCRLCKREYPHTDFSQRIARNGPGATRRTECKYCIRAWAKKSDSKVVNGDERWLRKRSANLQRKYGITHEEFLKLEEHQNGLCALCGKRPTTTRISERGTKWSLLHVDHDHETGAVRSLLCQRCNLTIGRVEVLGLAGVIKYLS